MSKKKASILDEVIEVLPKNIKEQIEINEELKNLIPKLKTDEFEQLRDNIKTEGCRDPLVLWHNVRENKYILIDGHNRYKICTDLNIDFEIKVLYFDYLHDVKAWMYKCQLGRRNLSLHQISYLRGKQYENEKFIHGGDRKSNDFSSVQNEHLKTSEKLAEEHNVNASTIKRDEWFAKGVDVIGEHNPLIKEEILLGTAGIAKAQVEELAKIAEEFGIDEGFESIDDIKNYITLKKNKSKVKKKSGGETETVDELKEYFKVIPAKSHTVDERLNAAKKARSRLSKLIAILEEKRNEKQKESSLSVLLSNDSSIDESEISE